MKYIRKRLIFILIAIFMTITPLSYAAAVSNVIYQYSTKENITSGAVLERISKFTTNGWQNINVIRVDLSNPNILVDTITNPQSFKSTATVEKLAGSKGAVAAVNSSFFSWMTNEPGSGYADGPIVESGSLISAVSGYNSNGDHMSSISFNNQNQVLFDFFKTKINLITAYGASIPVGQYNKPSRDFNDFTVLDRRWSTYSMGASQAYPDMNEVVVDGGKITDIRLSQPAVEIPQNGYVILTRLPGMQTLIDNFQIGDTINLSIETTPDWSFLKTSMTGGAILLKDGTIPSPFSVNITGKRARTAAGSTKDGTQLIIATVDEVNSLGMDQTDMANLMLQLGAYNAINFDGGGSTTMVARHPGDDGVSLINSPSDGSQRRVAAAMGIFSVAPPSSLDGFYISSDDDNVFVNTSRNFTVKGYDKYLNPIDVDSSQVAWSVSGVKGSFTGGTFYPKSTGVAKIKAAIGNISSETSIKVLSAPVQIKLNTGKLNLPVGSTKSLVATGINAEGFSAAIDARDLTWSVKGNIGTINNGAYTASGQGTGYLDASVGSVHAYCSVSVATTASTVIDNFESDNGNSYVSSPANIPGGYALYSEQFHSGNAAGKLTYDFSDTTISGVRAAYMAYPEGALTLSPDTVKLGLWVYNTHANPNWLRAEVYDSKGKKHYVEFTNNMDWTGWKYLEASMQNVDSPARLARLYVAQVNPVADSGDIYFDDLTQIASSYPSTESAAMPQDTAYADPANKSTVYHKNSNSFRLAVFGQSREPENLLEKLLTVRFSENINANYDAAAFVGTGKHGITNSIKKPFVSTSAGYKSVDIKNSRLIQLDTSKKGLRPSDTSQWKWFFDQLNSFDGDNIFIFLEQSAKSFSDSRESKLFFETVTKTKESTGKNIWVIYKNGANSSFMENGIKYLTTTGFEVEGLDPSKTDLARYLLITVNGKDITFEFKPIV